MVRRPLVSRDWGRGELNKQSTEDFKAVKSLCMNLQWWIHVIMCTCSVTSVMSDSLQPHELYPARLLCPWDSPEKDTGVGCHALLQGIFSTQGLNPRLLCLRHCRQIFYPLNHLGSPHVIMHLSKSIECIPSRVSPNVNCGFGWLGCIRGSSSVVTDIALWWPCWWWRRLCLCGKSLYLLFNFLWT